MIDEGGIIKEVTSVTHVISENNYGYSWALNAAAKAYYKEQLGKT